MNEKINKKIMDLLSEDKRVTQAKRIVDSLGIKRLGDEPLLGDFILCDTCGERHRIEYGEETLRDGKKKLSKMFSFYTCGEKLRLTGIAGRDIRSYFKVNHSISEIQLKE